MENVVEIWIRPPIMADVETPVGVCWVVVRGVRGVGFEPTLSLSWATERDARRVTTSPSPRCSSFPVNTPYTARLPKAQRKKVRCTPDAKKMAGGVVELWREREGARAESFITKSARGETFPLLRRR
jgi:hypothetical protein